MRRHLALTAAFLLTSTLTACGEKNAPAPPAAAPTTAASTSYSMADVQKHNSESSCWTAVNGKVYDVTAWISKHPGGPDRIRGLCGTDGTAQFTGQHKGASGPNDRLASFQIGVLAQ